MCQAASCTIKRPALQFMPQGISRGVVSKTKRWEVGQTLPFYFVDRDSQIEQLVYDELQVAMKYMNLRFDHTTKRSEAIFRIGMDPRLGLSNYIGTDCTIINPNENTTNLGVYQPGSVLHEIAGHGTGMLHEQSNPFDPQRYTPEHKEYFMMTQGWTSEMYDYNVTKIQNKYDVEATLRRDRESIMHYYVAPEHDVEGIGVPWNSTLSEGDKVWWQSKYPFADVQYDKARSFARKWFNERRDVYRLDKDSMINLATDIGAETPKKHTRKFYADSIWRTINP